MFKKILIVLLLVFAALTALIASRPEDFYISRSTVISAPPAAVFAQVNDLRNWEAWSPWGKLDPAMKKTYSEPSSGTSASYAWKGNHEVGEGSTTITESKPDELIKMRLEFLKPFKGTNDVAFTFLSQKGQTAVTWSMTGKNNFIGKAIGLVMNCEKMAGGQFEKGLSQLKAAVEKK